MTHRHPAAIAPLVDVHPIDCDCPAHAAPTAPRWTSLDVTAVQMIAGLVLGLLVSEVYALLTGGPHITVMFGGQG